MVEGRLIRLAPLQDEDRDLLYKWINDPELVRLNAPYRPVSRESHVKWFQNLGSDDRRVIFGIRRENDQLIGTVQLTKIHPVHRNAELIIRIGDRENQGRGLGTEALLLTLDFAWRDLNLHRVYLHVLSDNERAVRAYCRVGFRQEGRLRDAAFVGGAWRDLLVMGALQSEQESVAQVRPPNGLVATSDSMSR